MQIFSNYIDTHCHLDMMMDRLKFSSYRELKAALFPSNFRGCITVACEPQSIEKSLDILKAQGVCCAFGLHPHDARHYDATLEDRIHRALEHPKALAWGEIGLDYHYDHSPRNVQRSVFKRQLKNAEALKKPVVVHSREADADTRKIISDCLPEPWPIHLHCFTGTPEFAADMLSQFSNLYIGITGAVTFKNAGNIRAAVQSVPLKRLLLETDAPFMAPVPNRGKPAHCGHVPLIAAEIAKVKQCPIETVYTSAWRNTIALYGFPAAEEPGIQ